MSPRATVHLSPTPSIRALLDALCVLEQVCPKRVSQHRLFLSSAWLWHHRDAQDRLLQKDKTCPARTRLMMSWNAVSLLID